MNSVEWKQLMKQLSKSREEEVDDWNEKNLICSTINILFLRKKLKFLKCTLDLYYALKISNASKKNMKSREKLPEKVEFQLHCYF